MWLISAIFTLGVFWALIVPWPIELLTLLIWCRRFIKTIWPLNKNTFRFTGEYPPLAMTGVSFGLILFILAALLCRHDIRTLSGHLVRLPVANYSSTVEILAWPKTFDHYQSVPIKESVTGRKLRMLAPLTLVLAPGQEWKVTGRLKPPTGYLSPDAFDYRVHQLIRGFSGSLSVSHGQLIAQHPSWRQQLAGSIRLWLQQQPWPIEKKAWALALLLGDKNWLSDDQKQLLQQSQTQHLVVVSGLHLGLAFGLAFALFSLLNRCLPGQSKSWRQSLPWLVGLLVAFLYAALCQFAIPTQRALVMLAVPILIKSVGRHFTLGQCLALAWIIILGLQPFALLQIGTWLSFLAVSALMLALSGRGFIQRWISPQWRVFLLLSPVLIGLGLGLNVASIILNLVAIPLLGLVIMPCLVLVLTDWLWGPSVLSALATDGFFLAQTGLEWGMGVASQSYWPGVWPVMVWLPLFLGALLWLLPKGLPGRLPLGLVLAMPLAHQFPLNLTPRPETFTVTVLDVGQGQAIVLSVDGEPQVIMDLATESAFSQVVAPFLRREVPLGEVIPLIVVSHSDDDHAGGLASAQDSLAAQQWLGSGLEPHGIEQCRAGQNWEFQNLKVDVLFPPLGVPDSWNDNNRSCVLLISWQGRRILIPGDIEKIAEYLLLDSLPTLPTKNLDLLVLGHHGSKSSSSHQWLETWRPAMAVTSSGRWHRFGHPHSLVLDKLAARDIPLWSTSEHGSLAFRFTRQHLQVTPLKRRFWYWAK